MHIAYFVSPHGYGHAARACAVMSAIHELDRSTIFDIYTTIPEWFFTDSLQGVPFTYHSLLVDVGFIQTTPLSIDLPATIAKLNGFIPFSQEMTAGTLDLLVKNKTRYIFCDISPLGIFMARKLHIPSLLVENFTWDWLYQDYLQQEAGFQKPIEYYSHIYRKASYHIQTRPFCYSHCAPSLISDPVSRKSRNSRDLTRSRLGIGSQDPLIMITMGGIQLDFSFLKNLASPKDICFIVPGLEVQKDLPGNIIPLPHHSDFFHPDLVAACDAIIGKVGYSTLAEAYSTGTPFGYIPRRGFRESPVLERFILDHMVGIEIPEKEFLYGDWFQKASQLLTLHPNPSNNPNGADQIAEFFIGKAKTG